MVLVYECMCLMEEIRMDVVAFPYGFFLIPHIISTYTKILSKIIKTCKFCYIAYVDILISAVSILMGCLSITLPMHTRRLSRIFINSKKSIFKISEKNYEKNDMAMSLLPKSQLMSNYNHPKRIQNI